MVAFFWCSCSMQVNIKLYVSHEKKNTYFFKSSSWRQKSCIPPGKNNVKSWSLHEAPMPKMAVSPVADFLSKGGTSSLGLPEKYVNDKGSSYPRFRGENSKKNEKMETST